MHVQRLDLPADAPAYDGSPAHGDVATAVVIDGCTGWLHTASNGPCADMAMLICPAFAWDGLRSYHSLRQLAVELAAAGYPTLRLSYPGTGDSRDLAPCDDDPWMVWQRSVASAMDWLRTTAGVRRILLIGIRLGATLATLVAERRDDVAGLILLAPVLRGSSYMRQLLIEAQLESGGDAAPTGSLDFHELCLDAPTVKAIAGVDLRHAKVPAGLKMAIFGQSASRLADDCVRAWTGRGAETTLTGFDGLEPMLMQNTHGEPPPLDLSAVHEWITARFAAHPAATHRIIQTNATCLRLPDAVEVAVQFGEGGRLFGMLCQPDNPASGVAVIIGNTGRDPHYGVGRFGVELARCLAAKGIASFRVDFAGLGDSPGPTGQEHELSRLFATDRRGDFAAAIDALQQRGYRRFAVHGICSGAYHAFQAAVADARVELSLLVNFPVFTWNEGDTVLSVARILAPPRQYIAKVATLEFWRRLLARDEEILRILNAQRKRVQDRLTNLAGRLGVDWLRSDADRAMRTLSGRGARTLFLFSAGDPGIAALEQAFGRECSGLRRHAGATMQIVPDLNHILGRSDMRRMVTGLMIDAIEASTSAHDPIGGLVDLPGSAAARGHPGPQGAPTHDDPHDDHRPDNDSGKAARQDACSFG